MIFSSVKLYATYLYITRSKAKYLMTVYKINKQRGKVFATRSGLDGKEIHAQWYGEGTLTQWRKRPETIHRLLADTGCTASVLSNEITTSGLD